LDPKKVLGHVGTNRRSAATAARNARNGATTNFPQGDVKHEVGTGASKCHKPMPQDIFLLPQNLTFKPNPNLCGNNNNNNTSNSNSNSSNSNSNSNNNNSSNSNNNNNSNKNNNKNHNTTNTNTTTTVPNFAAGGKD